MLANRPDVRNAERGMEQAFYGVNQARTAFYPSVILSGSAGWTNNSGAGIVNPGKLLATAVGSITQSLFNKGQNSAQLRIAKAKQEEAKLSFQQALLNAGSEVNNALTQYQTAQSKALEYENQNAEPCDWLISFDDIRALLATGAGFLTASNDEEGTAKKITSIISRMRTYGYLAPIEDDDMYVLTPLVPMVLDRGLADQWLGSETTDENASADGRTDAGPDDRPMEDIEQDAFDFNTDDNRFDEEEH